jgi:hypothetical protein
MPARIIEANITIRGGIIRNEDGTSVSTDDLPDEPPYEPIDVAPPAILVGGEVSRMRQTFTHSGARSEHYRFMTLNIGDTRRLWIFGYVKYTDGLSEDIREYRWLRAYSPLLSSARQRFCFEHVNRPNYNSAD